MRKALVLFLATTATTLAIGAGLAAPASAAGGSTGGGGGGGGGGGNKATCIVLTGMQLTATATAALSGDSFSATYTLATCQSKTKVALTATDIATGDIVYQVPDLLGTTAVWTLPSAKTSYLVEASATSGLTGATLATASTIVSTAGVLPPCTPTITETVTTGYYGFTPAIWNATNAQNCMIPSTHTHVRIRDLSTGLVAYETTSPAMSWMLDYEGSVVPYSTPFQIDAELVSSSGEVLASTTQYATSSPLK